MAHRLPKGVRAGALATMTLVLVAACAGASRSRPAADPSAGRVVPAPGLTVPGATPKTSAGEAVAALLSAEAHNDHAASFLVLSSAARATYRSPDDWARRRTELPAVIGFSLQSGGPAGSVTAVVQHHPGLDPFIGLSSSQDREVWHTSREAGGWLVDGDPETTLLLPSDAGAGPAALAWATAVQRCDRPASQKLQAVEPVLGTSDGASMLCHASGALSAGPVTRPPPGPATAGLVAQYTAEALGWARAVRISGGPQPFSVTLAPIGETWKVVGVFD